MPSTARSSLIPNWSISSLGAILDRDSWNLPPTSLKKALNLLSIQIGSFLCFELLKLLCSLLSQVWLT